MIQPKDILLFLSVLHQGDWKGIYADIKRKRSVTQEEVHQAYKEVKSQFLTILDPEYPSGLTQVMNPPFLLYYYGNLSLLNQKYRLTCVGTRTPTLYQSETTYRFVKEMEEKCENQTVIVSGMALGLDSSALRGAMEQNAPIISVIGSGIDDPYPKKNKDIYDYCVSQKGLVLSEYPGKVKAQPKNFVFRNRILVGLSQGIYIGGGKNRSGTSATVAMGLDYGKNIYALPCNVTGDDLSNEIIRDGAKPILSSDDLLLAIRECALSME